jgi:uncharacterized protein (DUF58 family)
MPETLTPPSVEVCARGRKLLPFAFGPRFFVMLLIGFVWLVPAWWSPRFIVGMFVWDALVLVAWLFDLFRVPVPSELMVSRNWSGPLTLGRAASVDLRIHNLGRIAVSVTLVDRTPAALREEPPVLTAIIRPSVPALQHYTVLPRERGDAELGELFLRYRSGFGFAERWAVAPLAQTVCVLPDLLQAEEQALLLIRSRQIEMQNRRHRQPGMGREFESLREYREGDEFRDISWSATARRHQLITRTYTAERSQRVWIVLDAGRLLRARVRESGCDVRFSKLDYAVNAALSVAQVASRHGDRVGLIAYGRSIQQSAAPGRGPLHIRTLVDALARVRSEPGEADHARAARTITQKQTRRSLVVWITDFAETPATPDVIEYSAQLGKHHLVLFAAIGQTDLAAAAQSIPETEVEMFRQAAALEIVDRRDLLLRKLRQTGVLALELAPGRLTTSLVNEYLQIKDRGLL